LQPGAQLDLTWRARLDDHIGSFTVELQQSRSAAAMGDRISLAGLNAVTALLSFCLPEREPHPALYRRSLALLDHLESPALLPLAYLGWEQRLLDEMGFGLSLERCAVTGATNDLVFVSPKSGRAVSRIGAGKWADRLLPLPQVLLRPYDAPPSEIADALDVTGHFLGAHLAPQLGGRPLPQARQRFVDLVRRGQNSPQG
jgi:DNA repair protein RecO (recombination protein O)